jgi:hypothetical protein
MLSSSSTGFRDQMRSTCCIYPDEIIKHRCNRLDLIIIHLYKTSMQQHLKLGTEAPQLTANTCLTYYQSCKPVHVMEQCRSGY